LRLRGIPIAEVTHDHLSALVEDSWPESRTLDYKGELPGRTDEEKKKFLADVCALANTNGGIIAYGIITGRDAIGDDTGIPTELTGLGNANLDKEKLRLAEIAQRGLSPVLGNRLVMRAIPIPDRDGPVLLLGVPASLLAPHMVSFQQSNKFHRRSDAGNYLPDVQEIRRMFSEHDLWSEQAERFRAKRITRVDTAPVKQWLDTRSPFFFHVLPLGRLDTMLDLGGRYQELLPFLFPPGYSGANGRFNADGLMGYRQTDKFISGYTQLFRFGGFEGFDSENVRAGRYGFDDGQGYLSADHILQSAMAWFPKAVEFLATRMDVVAPYGLGVALKGIRGSEILSRDGWSEGSPIDVDELLLPLVVVNEPDTDTVRDALWPLFDVVWQSAGYAKAPRIDV
jgi:hypothetical protein